MNLLYAKIVGERVRLNPLAATLSLAILGVDLGSDDAALLFRSSGATKIVCDYVDALRGLGAWLGE